MKLAGMVCRSCDRLFRFIAIWLGRHMRRQPVIDFRAIEQTPFEEVFAPKQTRQPEQVRASLELAHRNALTDAATAMLLGVEQRRDDFSALLGMTPRQMRGTGLTLRQLLLHSITARDSNTPRLRPWTLFLDEDDSDHSQFFLDAATHDILAVVEFLQAQSLKRSGNVIPTCSILMCYGMTSEFMRGTTASRGSTKPWGHTC